MPRKPDRSRTEWTPSPQCEEALARIIDTAHLSAAALIGERPTDNPEKNASPLALVHAMWMIYFFFRIDPRDMLAVASGPGSLADFGYRPFPPVRPRRRASAAPELQ